MLRTLRLLVLVFLVSIIAYEITASPSRALLIPFRKWLSLEAPKLFVKLQAEKKFEQGLITYLERGFQAATKSRIGDISYVALFSNSPHDLPQLNLKAERHGSWDLGDFQNRDDWRRAKRRYTDEIIEFLRHVIEAMHHMHEIKKLHHALDSLAAASDTTNHCSLQLAYSDGVISVEKLAKEADPPRVLVEYLSLAARFPLDFRILGGLAESLWRCGQTEDAIRIRLLSEFALSLQRTLRSTFDSVTADRQDGWRSPGDWLPIGDTYLLLFPHDRYMCCRIWDTFNAYDHLPVVQYHYSYTQYAFDCECKTYLEKLNFEHTDSLSKGQHRF